MKLFNLDWHDFIDRLDVWRQLSLKARHGFAELRPNEGISLGKLDGQEDLLVKRGYVELIAKGAKARLTKSCADFGRAIRAITRHDIVANATSEAMLGYMREHFTGDELAGMCQNMRYGYGIERLLLPEVLSVGWVEAFLNEPEISNRNTRPQFGNIPRWLSAPDPDDKPIVDPHAAKLLVRHLLELPEPVPFAELPGRWADVPPSALGTAILLGVGQLVLFPMMRQSDMTPMLGLWPTICQRLHRPKAKPPKPIKPQTVAYGAFLVEDMTTALVAATAEPLRLRGNDSALFAKAEREIEANLMSIPSLVLKLLRCPNDGRIRVAMEWLQMLGLARRAGVPGDDLRFEATGKGERWLAQSAKGRLKAILDHLLLPTMNHQHSTQSVHAYGDALNDFDDDDFDGYAYHRKLEFLPSELPVSNGEKHDKELRCAVVSAMTTLPEKTVVLLSEFLQWQAQQENPLPTLFTDKNGPRIYTGWSHRTATSEEMEHLWGNFLMEMLCRRLVPLGCVRVGMIDDSDDVYIGLTDPGRYLLGVADDFDYGHDHDAQGQIVVQPNFEIVFLAPSPLAEASLARFAQRKSRGVGSLFSITKKSILAAAGSRLTAAQVLETLTRLSAKPVPANVTREISGWFDQCRRVNVHSAVLIHCPDADTAARVVAASGNKAVLLTDTVVELIDARAKTELLRKLHGLGIFVEAAMPAERRRVRAS